jgi:hypothetical protein
MFPKRDVCVRGALCVVSSLVAVLVPTIASAQAAVDARMVEFEPSPDHDRVTDGVPHVASYSFVVYAAGSATPLQTADLGKPAPGADGLVRIDFVERLPAALVPGEQYQARVAASGPGGVAASDLSNVFSFTPTCEPALSAAGASLGDAASSGSVTVTVAQGCAWTAASPAAWLTITSGAAGSGAGTVAFSATANTAPTARTAALTIAGETFTVTQSGAAPCAPSLSASSGSLAASLSTGSVNVSAGAQCAWTAASPAAWLTVTSGASGTGDGTVAFRATANTSTTSRTATMTIAGQAFSVTQAGAACTYAISPSARSSPAAGETVSVSVTTGAGCSWTRSSALSWLTFSGATNRTGSGTVTVTVAANAATSLRTGTATIAGRTFTVNQTGTPACTYTITPAAVSLASAGGTSSVAVTTATGCGWTVAGAPEWITIANGTRAGSGSVVLAIAANDGAARSATLTVAGKSVAVSQAQGALPAAPSNLRVVVGGM